MVSLHKAPHVGSDVGGGVGLEVMNTERIDVMFLFAVQDIMLIRSVAARYS